MFIRERHEARPTGLFSMFAQLVGALTLGLLLFGASETLGAQESHQQAVIQQEHNSEHDRVAEQMRSQGNPPVDDTGNGLIQGADGNFVITYDRQSIIPYLENADNHMERARVSFWASLFGAFTAGSLSIGRGAADKIRRRREGYVDVDYDESELDGILRAQNPDHHRSVAGYEYDRVHTMAKAAVLRQDRLRPRPDRTNSKLFRVGHDEPTVPMGDNVYGGPQRMSILVFPGTPVQEAAASLYGWGWSPEDYKGVRRPESVAQIPLPDLAPSHAEVVMRSLYMRPRPTEGLPAWAAATTDEGGTVITYPLKGSEVYTADEGRHWSGEVSTSTSNHPPKHSAETYGRHALREIGDLTGGLPVFCEQDTVQLDLLIPDFAGSNEPTQRFESVLAA